MNYHEPHARLSHDVQMMHPSINRGIDGSRMMVSSNRLENINMIQGSTEQLAGLYLGDIVSTIKVDILKANKIEAVLSCMYENVSLQHFVMSHKILSIKDTLEYPIINYFDEAVAWIHKQRQEKHNVLVHCHAGISRSATILIAYFIRTQHMNPLQALEFIRSKRSRVKPNMNFWNQLNEYHRYWSTSNRMPERRISKIESIKENTIQHALSVPHRLLESRPSLKPSDIINSRISNIANTSKPKEIKGIEEVKTQKDQSRFSSKIQSSNMDESRSKEGEQQRRILRQRKKIFDKNYIQKPMKTEEMHMSFSHMPQNKQKISLKSNSMLHPQLFNSSIYSNQSQITHEQPNNHKQTPQQHQFPYNINLMERLQPATVYRARQSSMNVMSPFEVNTHFP